MERRNNKLLYALLSLLLIAVAAQSYFIYDLKNEKNTNEIVQIQQTQGVVDPFVEIRRMQEEMQKSFGHFNSMFANDPFFQEAFASTSSPLADMREENGKYIVELNIPGIEKQNIKVSNKGNVLNVEAKNMRSTDTNDTHYMHKEIYSQSYYRSFMMPNDADMDKLDTNYKDGKLQIVVPKKS
jgi:HSP20 family protein